MIHELGSHRFINEYAPVPPSADSLILSYKENELLLRNEDGIISFISYEELCRVAPEKKDDLRFFFRLDDTAFFLCEDLDPARFPGASMEGKWLLRTARPKHLAYAGITGHQLYTWYRNRKFCPACGTPTVHSDIERAMVCPACGLTEYPKICPAVIVAIRHENKLLLTKYANGTGRYALVAGYSELGETIEQTVHREVMEETGLRVKNLRYYKSQPWPFSDTLLFGFICELDGDDAVRLQEQELSEARWLTREEMPDNDGVSLTRELITKFKEGEF